MHYTVSGDIAVFGKAPELERLDLSHSGVFGDLQSLENATKLKNLWLQGTKVTGDLAALSRLKLTSLHLGDTSITGDLASLSMQLRDMYFLGLQNSKVFGDIGKAFGVADTKTVKVRTLRLRNTKVSGDVATWPGLSRVFWIDVAYTDVSGDVMSMLPKWSHVRGVDFSSTQVTGRITRSWEGCCKSLKTFRYLGLSSRTFKRLLCRWLCRWLWNKPKKLKKPTNPIPNLMKVLLWVHLSTWHFTSRVVPSD